MQCADAAYCYRRSVVCLYVCLTDSPRYTCSNNNNNINNNNNNNYDNVYGAITMIKVIDESSPGSFDECRLSAGWPPTLRPSQSTSAVSPPKIGSYHPYPPSPLLLLLSP